MPTLRECFHEFGNWQNKISLAAITSKEILDVLLKTKELSKEDKLMINKAVNYLMKIDGYIVASAKLVDSFKPYVYSQINPDSKITIIKSKQKGLQ